MKRQGVKVQDPEARDRLWIELEYPVGCGERIKEVAERRAAAATKVLRMLGDPQSSFWWFDKEQRYCFDFGGGGGYAELQDHGYWLNLTHITRDK